MPSTSGNTPPATINVRGYQVALPLNGVDDLKRPMPFAAGTRQAPISCQVSEHITNYVGSALNFIGLISPTSELPKDQVTGEIVDCTSPKFTYPVDDGFSVDQFAGSREWGATHATGRVQFTIHSDTYEQIAMWFRYREDYKGTKHITSVSAAHYIKDEYGNLILIEGCPFGINTVQPSYIECMVPADFTLVKGENIFVLECAVASENYLHLASISIRPQLKIKKIEAECVWECIYSSQISPIVGQNYSHEVKIGTDTTDTRFKQFSASLGIKIENSLEEKDSDELTSVSDKLTASLSLDVSATTSQSHTVSLSKEVTTTYSFSPIAGPAKSPYQYFMVWRPVLIYTATDSSNVRRKIESKCSDTFLYTYV